MERNLNFSDKTENRLLAPCGINCGVCYVYLREKKPCRGCWGADAHKPKHCLVCSIRNCEFLAKPDSKFCYDCEKYPCTRLKQLDKRYRAKYSMSLIENLNGIKTVGLDEFVQKEHERWTCQNCGGTVCMHLGYCIDCSKKN